MFDDFGREIGRPIAFLWALGTIMSSIIWHFPQYGLVAGAARDLGNVFGGAADMTMGQSVGLGLRLGGSIASGLAARDIARSQASVAEANARAAPRASRPNASGANGRARLKNNDRTPGGEPLRDGDPQDFRRVPFG